ncbi:kinase-like protein [Amylocystis lapponica]|nr:kinase-like protein [Amylocystis lapponica]
MAPKQPCAKYEYVVTAAGPQILPVPDVHSKDEESPADYNAGGYLQVRLRDTFKDGRYIVLRKLGWGHFSTVWLVKDTQANRHSALKVVKSAGRYAETARDEIKLLGQVMDANLAHPGRDHVVAFLDSFQHCSPEDIHVCIVFEPLGENLLALIERHKKTGVPPALVKLITRQVLLGLEYLHDECDLVHTDIKPENIMIAIPDVEAHIQAQLSMSPDPTSRKVGVPSKQLMRAGVAIPRRAGGRERHVQIFDSQPLSSPSSYSPSLSASSSPNTRGGLQMSRLASTQSTQSVFARSAKGKGKQASDTLSSESDASSSGSGSGSDLSGVASSLASIGAETIATSVTSVGSLAETAKKLSIVTSPGSSSMYPCVCGRPSAHGRKPLATPGLSDEETQRHRPHTGPSLLSQTAPSDFKSTLCPHMSPSDSPLCISSPQRINCDASSSSLPPSPTATPPPISIKIADLGNATPTQRHYTEDIQTRQYRAPEVIMGRTDWGPTADVWSVACVVFELLTAEYLFDPQSQGDVFGKDDDHLAQVIELLGDFTGDVKFGGRFSRELFDSTGALRYIRSLKPWPLKRVMAEKYLWAESDADALCAFIEPMLTVDHTARKQARQMVNHPWLQVDPLSEELWGW